MFYFEIIKNSKIVLSNINDYNNKDFFVKEKNKKNSKERMRSYYLGNKKGSIWIITNDSELYIGNKSIRKLAVNLNILYDVLNDAFIDKYNRDYHTIKSIQAMMGDYSDKLISEKDLKSSINYSSFKKSIEKRIEHSVPLTADTIIQLKKRIQEMSMHFFGLELLNEGIESKLNKQNHDLEKILLSTFSIFSKDIHDKKITFNINFFDKNIFTDYKIFNLAMHHFFQNAHKYTKNNTDINADYNNGILKISMESKYIDNVEDIFNDGHSTSFDVGGKGMGMGIIKESLKILDIEFNVEKGIKDSSNHAINIFIFKLNQ